MDKRETSIWQVENSGNISVERKERAVAVLCDFVFDTKSAELVWSAARTAHEAAGITQEDFENSLKGCGGVSKFNWILHPTHDFSADPYRQLGLIEWAKYLYYGGTRILGSDGLGMELYARDQDVVMLHFGIEPMYDLSPQGRRLRCPYSRGLVEVIQLRNRYAYQSGKMEPVELLRDYRGLVSCLEPLARTPWAGQEACVDQLRALERDFYSALEGKT